MIAVFGAAGRVGAATVRRLGESGAQVRAVLHQAPADTRVDTAASVVGADLRDPQAIAAALQDCDSVQVICPVPPLATDVSAHMGTVIDALVQGLSAAPTAAIVAISDYGAEIPAGTGITAIFNRLESRLGELPNPLTFVRSAEHMHNWMRQLPATLQTGVLDSMHQPLTKAFPTVHAPDLGEITADFLLAAPKPSGSQRVVYVEGPRRYSALDVAAALAAVTATEITARELGRQKWEPMLLAAGATPQSAELIAQLYDAHNAGRIDALPGAEIRHTSTSLEDALAAAIPSGLRGRRERL
jgi:uncharacterized protein YbjT (DUF2867 family)